MHRSRAGWALLVCLFAASAVAQTTPEEFTVIALPDTQNYSQYYPHIFNAQTRWIAENATRLNIKFVVGLGDVVNNGSDPNQQQNADAAVRTLDNAGIPYLLALGNHDYVNAYALGRDASKFNQYFGPWRYQGKSWYRGNYPAGSNENFYGVFDIGGTRYLVMALEFYPRDHVLTWASSVIAANPDTKVILILHAFLTSGGYRTERCDKSSAYYFGLSKDNDGEEMWQKMMRKHNNIMLIMNGHFHGFSRRADLGDYKNLVNQIQADYQSDPEGGAGYLRIMTFKPSLNRIDVKTYSPYKNAYRTDGGNQFSVPMIDPGARTGAGRVHGKVWNSSCLPIGGAAVRWSGGSTTTRSDGSYFLATTPGTHTITASGSDWSSSRTVTVHDNYATQLHFRPSTSSGTSGVTVSSPGAGTTVGSPVHFVASATASKPITSMHIYVDGNLTYRVSSATVDTWLSLSSGTRNITVQAWDSGGAVYKRSFSITVSGTSTTSGVTIASPSNGATVSTSTRLTATAASSRTITAMKVYVDGSGAYSAAGGSLDTYLNLAVGTRSVVVKAWDSSGASFSSRITLYVR